MIPGAPQPIAGETLDEYLARVGAWLTLVGNAVAGVERRVDRIDDTLAALVGSAHRVDLVGRRLDALAAIVGRRHDEVVERLGALDDLDTELDNRLDGIVERLDLVTHHVNAAAAAAAAAARRHDEVDGT